MLRVCRGEEVGGGVWEVGKKKKEGRDRGEPCWFGLDAGQIRGWGGHSHASACTHWACEQLRPWNTAYARDGHAGKSARLCAMMMMHIRVRYVICVNAARHSMFLCRRRRKRCTRLSEILSRSVRAGSAWPVSSSSFGHRQQPVGLPHSRLSPSDPPTPNQLPQTH